MTESTDQLVSGFRDFCLVDRQLEKSTTKLHLEHIRRLLQWLGAKPLSQATLREYLGQFNGSNPSTYANALKSLKVFCRDFLGRPELIESFRFPQVPFKPKIIPIKEELQRFYGALDSLKDRALFLLYASSGLRRREALGLNIEDLDLNELMIRPSPHTGRTKHTWITFFNCECAEALRHYLDSRKDSNAKLFPMATTYERLLWKKARRRTGFDMTPQILREWFCAELGSLGVQDRYIDAFCGRVPKSVLARHYSDYCPERLREIYGKANLKVLS